MRFYKNKQAEMLRSSGIFLQREKEKLVKKVPALSEFITQFAEEEEGIYAVVIGNPHAVKAKTLDKQNVRGAFVKIVSRLIAVLKASGYAYKNKPPDEIRLTQSDLKKMEAEKLGRVYGNVFAAAKKIRNLAYYGLSQDDMLDAQAYYKEFIAVKKAPAQKKKEVAKRNEAVNEAVKEGILFLKTHIDPLMLIAAEDDFELRLNYKAIRQVLPRAKGRPSDAEAAYRKSREKK